MYFHAPMGFVQINVGMRKIVAGFAISLDGYIDAADGNNDWISMDPDFDFSEHLRRFDTFLFGRKTYQKVLTMEAGGNAGIRSLVISSTLTRVADGYELAGDDLVKTVSGLREQPGRDIAVYGGAGLLTSLLNIGQVDELQMSLIPAIIGDGLPMVEPILNRRIKLNLMETRQLSTGTMILTYEVNKNPG